MVRHAASNETESISPSSRRNFIKLIDDRLHAVSSRNMYSEHGLLALIRAVFGHVCQSLTVVSNCMPGSPQMCVASAICRIRSRALKVCTGALSRTALVVHSPPPIPARMDSSVTRTLLFEFGKNTDE